MKDRLRLLFPVTAVIVVWSEVMVIGRTFRKGNVCMQNLGERFLACSSFERRGTVLRETQCESISTNITWR